MPFIKYYGEKKQDIILDCQRQVVSVGRENIYTQAKVSKHSIIYLTELCPITIKIMKRVNC